MRFKASQPTTYYPGTYMYHYNYNYNMQISFKFDLGAPWKLQEEVLQSHQDSCTQAMPG